MNDHLEIDYVHGEKKANIPRVLVATRGGTLSFSNKQLTLLTKTDLNIVSVKEQTRPPCLFACRFLFEWEMTSSLSRFGGTKAINLKGINKIPAGDQHEGHSCIQLQLWREDRCDQGIKRPSPLYLKELNTLSPRN